ncbi:MAG TPA: PilZ domain-containing protein [Vicinamibacteria bacterium]|nr:PilZ domain-containing protein [Vicinamibacteria bacterium]
MPRTPYEPRRDLPVPVRVALTTSGGTTTVEYAVNLSAGGACLQVRRPLAEGERVHLAFELPQDELPVSVAARVVWCTRDEERGERGRFCEMGVQFSDADATLVERLGRFARQPVNRRR